MTDNPGAPHYVGDDCPGGHAAGLYEKCETLKAQVFAACSVLRELERCNYYYEGECPLCLRLLVDGHESDCRVEKVLSWGAD